MSGNLILNNTYNAMQELKYTLILLCSECQLNSYFIKHLFHISTTTTEIAFVRNQNYRKVKTDKINYYANSNKYRNICSQLIMKLQHPGQKLTPSTNCEVQHCIVLISSPL